MISSNDKKKPRVTQKDKLATYNEVARVVKDNNKDQPNKLAMIKNMESYFNPDINKINHNNLASWLRGFSNDQDKSCIAEEVAESCAAILDSWGTDSASRVADDIRKGLYLYRNPKPDDPDGPVILDF